MNIQSGQVCINSLHDVSVRTYLLSNSVGVLISTKSDPTSFSDFNDANGNNQLVTQFFQATGEGLAYFSVDLSKSNVTGLKDGVNATFEVTFNGGDGTLYQVCALINLP